MKADDIRGRAYDSSKSAGELVPFVKEIAAQLAEMNAKLNIILNLPLIYNIIEDVNPDAKEQKKSNG